MLDGVLTLVSHEPLAGAAAVVRAFDPSIPELLADADRLDAGVPEPRAERAPGDGARGRNAHRDDAHDPRPPHRARRRDGRCPTLAVWVEDTGRGMDAEELRQATTPFFTTRPGGTGLGLAVADYWVARHRGSLHLESEKGVGTRVRIALPVRREP